MEGKVNVIQRKGINDKHKNTNVNPDYLIGLTNLLHSSGTLNFTPLFIPGTPLFKYTYITKKNVEIRVQS